MVIERHGGQSLGAAPTNGRFPSFEHVSETWPTTCVQRHRKRRTEKVSKDRAGGPGSRISHWCPASSWLQLRKNKMFLPQASNWPSGAKGVVSKLFSSVSQITDFCDRPGTALSTLGSPKSPYRVSGLGPRLAATGDRVLGGLGALSAI
jgi:hypothetical protein